MDKISDLLPLAMQQASQPAQSNLPAPSRALSPPSQLNPTAAALARYDTAEHYLAQWTERQMTSICRNKQLIHGGGTDCPTLGIIRQAYGIDNLRLWLAARIWHTLNFLGDTKCTSDQIADVAEMLADEYGHWSIGEVLDWLRRIKVGQYTYYPTGNIQQLMVFARHYQTHTRYEMRQKYYDMGAADYDAVGTAIMQRYSQQHDGRD